MFIYVGRSEDFETSCMAWVLGYIIGIVLFFLLLIYATLVALWWAAGIGAAVGFIAYLYAYLGHLSLLGKADYDLSPDGMRSIWGVHCRMLALSDEGLDGVVGWRGPVSPEEAEAYRARSFIGKLIRLVWHFFCTFLMPGQLLGCAVFLVLGYLVAVIHQVILFVLK